MGGHVLELPQTYTQKFPSGFESQNIPVSQKASPFLPHGIPCSSHIPSRTSALQWFCLRLIPPCIIAFPQRLTESTKLLETKITGSVLTLPTSPVPPRSSAESFSVLTHSLLTLERPCICLFCCLSVCPHWRECSQKSSGMHLGHCCLCREHTLRHWYIAISAECMLVVSVFQAMEKEAQMKRNEKEWKGEEEGK